MSDVSSWSIACFKGSIIAAWALGLVTVCLRFLARRLSKAGFWYDDWLMVPAILFTTALCFIPTVWLVNIINLPMEANEPQAFQKAIFVSEICWEIALWIVKYATLAFYWRLFGRKGQSARLIIWVLVGIVTCWGATLVFMTFLRCIPSGSVLATSKHGDCRYGHSDWFFIGTSIAHIITDVVLIGLPVPLISKLHIRRSQKVILIAIFAMGSFMTVISLIRVIYMSKADSSMPVLIWSNVEANTCMICACLPSLGPIPSFIIEKLDRFRKRKSTHKRGSKLLMDMLPTGKSAPPALRPISRAQTSNHDPYTMLDSATVLEVEAINPREPELDAEAPSGPHILEIETQPPIFELEARNPIAEM